MFLGAIIGDFGKTGEGLNLLRINGTKEEIKNAIDEMIKLGCEVWQQYELEKSHKHYSVLIKVQIPERNDVQDQGD